MRGAVAPRTLQPQHDVTRAILLEPFVGDRGARDVPAQAFEFLTLMFAAALAVVVVGQINASRRAKGLLA